MDMLIAVNIENKILNSFEKTLKMLKIMQTCKNIFFRFFCCFFSIILDFLKTINIMRLKIG